MVANLEQITRIMQNSACVKLNPTKQGKLFAWFADLEIRMLRTWRDILRIQAERRSVGMNGIQ